MKTKRIYIGIYGKRNNGKSSLINAIANQEIAIVSEHAGTTTDPVKKNFEIFGIGPCVFVDTAGIDDVGKLGELRVKKTIESLKIIDVAILVVTENQLQASEKELIDQFKQFKIPFLIVYNKIDLYPINQKGKDLLTSYKVPLIQVNSKKREGINELITQIVKITPPSAYTAKTLIGDLIQANDSIVLVMPQDEEAPEGRLILPQVQLIRDILDNKAIAIGLQVEQLSTLLQLQVPKMVITDSQVFKEVSQIVPTEIPLTSFSIILARAKGHFNNYLKGTPYIDKLKEDDHILLLESCSHPVHCQDIGRNKIPNLLQKVTGKRLHFDMVSALSPLPDLSHYSMAIQCGACMVTDKQINNRIATIVEHNIPISNYGMTLAYLTGTFNRSIELFV